MTHVGYTQCVRACLDVLEMVPWDGCKAGQITSSPRVEVVLVVKDVKLFVLPIF
jgi:hypothetical protein